MDVECHYCGNPTNGSQYHRACFTQEKREVYEKAEEAHYELMERTIELEERIERAIIEENELTAATWEAIAEESEVSAVQSDIPLSIAAPGTLPSSFYTYDENVEIRMRKGVHIRKTDIYHLGCVKANIPAYDLGGFSAGILTAEFANIKLIEESIEEFPCFFWCKACGEFIWPDICYDTNEQFEIPDEDVWPTCSNLVMSFEYKRDVNYVTLHSQHCFTDESPRKKTKLHE
uniref:NS3 n=1 Tax=uncultured densovirus TaxID=748192 RepID=A0A7M4CBJ4_9VIRU|nr:NS3 [uncultured densovirus]